MGSVGHGIRLWFALTGVIVDCRFLRPCRAIEMIEMIEMIEVIWGSAGRGCAFWSGSGGGRVGDILNCGPLDSGVGYGFSPWFEVFGKTGNPRFPDVPHTLTFDFALFKGRGAF